MMKFKSLFRRKASPTGHGEANSATSPSASSISHSSSSSSLATHSASSPIHSHRGAELSQGGLSSSPITITSRIRSATDSNILVPIPISPPAAASSDYLALPRVYESSDHNEYQVDAENLEVTAPGAELKQELEYHETDMINMRDSPDHSSGLHGSTWERQSRQSSGSEA